MKKTEKKQPNQAPYSSKYKLRFVLSERVYSRIKKKFPILHNGQCKHTHNTKNIFLCVDQEYKTIERKTSEITRVRMRNDIERCKMALECYE